MNQHLIEHLIPITLANLHREYPNGILHHLQGEEDTTVRPSQLHPLFYGCYDWHSSVHSHWQVLRAIRLYPNASFASAATEALNRSFTPAHVAAEMTYLQRRPGFEMPYGMAWLLQLMAELREWKTPRAKQWQAILSPLEDHASQRLGRYFTKLPFPLRSGLHNQSAFAMGLAWDWAQIAGDEALRDVIQRQADKFFGNDRNAPFAYEPSGVDFLSPTLAEADLMRRILSPDAFQTWFGRFVGRRSEILRKQLKPVGVVDFADGQLAHFTGLNLSRAWMLEGICTALPKESIHEAILSQLADHHREIGLRDAFHEDYMVSHWAPSFALYLLTQRGISVGQ